VSDSSSGVERGWRVGAALLAVAQGNWIWWLSSQTFPATTGAVWGFVGNSVHFALFGVLAFLLLEVVRKEGRCSRDALVGVLVLTATYGMVDEWHQSWTPGRFPDAFDVCVDALGGVAAVSLWWGVRGPGRFWPALGRATALGLCVLALNAWRTWGPLG
jgi:VanZ like family